MVGTGPESSHRRWQARSVSARAREREMTGLNSRRGPLADDARWHN
jgi:hypothetical protein